MANIEVQLPEMFSYSSLWSIDECPKKWGYSRTQGLSECKPKLYKGTFVGNMVHEVLSELLVELTAIGKPILQSPEGRSVVLSPTINERVRRSIDEWSKERQHRFDIQFDCSDSYMVAEISNEVISRIHKEYSPLSKSSAQSQRSPTPTGTASKNPPTMWGRLQQLSILSEECVRHPLLPVMGIIDIISLDQHGRVSIIDVKTGKESAEHIQQVLLYALIFWRMTDVMPVQWKLSYSHYQNSGIIEQAQLEQIEQQVQDKIAFAQQLVGPVKDLEARPSAQCKWCSMRAFCEEYWQSKTIIHGGDVELKLTSSLQGKFFTVLLDDSPALLRYHSRLAFLLSDTEVTVRMLNCMIRNEEDTKVIYVAEQTEIYTV